MSKFSVTVIPYGHVASNLLSSVFFQDVTTHNYESFSMDMGIH